jgi:hypothetical protein
MDLIIRSGAADVSKRRNDGASAIDIAKQEGHRQCLDLLKAAAAGAGAKASAPGAKAPASPSRGGGGGGGRKPVSKSSVPPPAAAAAAASSGSGGGASGRLSRGNIMAALAAGRRVGMYAGMQVGGTARRQAGKWQSIAGQGPPAH